MWVLFALRLGGELRFMTHLGGGGGRGFDWDSCAIMAGTCSDEG